MNNFYDSPEKNSNDFLKPALRFDGIYVRRGKDYNGYLRFFPSGTVISVSSTGTPEQVARWFDESNSSSSKGRYSCGGNKLSFSILIDRVDGRDRNCNYQGFIKDDGGLLLEWYSEATDYKACGVYEFCPFESTKSQEKNSKDLSNPALRFDGIYVRRGKDYSKYLRFFPSGTVISVSSTGTPEQVARWFNESHSSSSKGRYSCVGNKLSFSILIDRVGGRDRNCNYQGFAKDDGGLLLEWYSEATNNSERDSYEFYPFESTESQEKNSKDLSNPALRFDGFYVLRGKDYSSYLRFFPSGTVISVSSTGTPEQVARWFNESYSTSAKGRYVCSGNSISFSTLVDRVGGRDRNCNYQGVIKADGGLLLESYSEATNYSARETYEFYRI